ncbi:AAA family ATPase [Gordonia sp. NPDC003422]
MTHTEGSPGSQPPPWLRVDADDDEPKATAAEAPAEHYRAADAAASVPLTPISAAVLPSATPSRGWMPAEPVDDAPAADSPESPAREVSPSPETPAPEPTEAKAPDTDRFAAFVPAPPSHPTAPPQQVPSYPPAPPMPAPPPWQGAPAHQVPPGYPHPAGPQNLAPPPGLDPHRLVRHSAPAPSRGWRQALHAASGGLINLGDSKSQQQLNEMVARVRQPIQGDFRLAVLSLKGGVGKTTTTIGLGSAFASLRGDRVIAVDANPDLGTLASRVPQQTASTVRSVLHDPNIHRYTDIRRHTSQASSRLEVLASERDPAVSEAFSAEEYRKVLGVLENFYNIIMTDCGTGLMHSAMQGVLSTANAIVLVTSPAVDGAQSASATLDWLNAHGYQRLVSQAIVVISASKPGGAPIDLDLLADHFRGRTRAVQIIPYDDHLATGSYVELDQLHRRTRTAFLELAATVADSFSVNMAPPPTAQQPWVG